MKGNYRTTGPVFRVPLCDLLEALGKSEPPKPPAETVLAWLQMLDSADFQELEERAAILEYCSDLPRGLAEGFAALLTWKPRRGYHA